MLAVYTTWLGSKVLSANFLTLILSNQAPFCKLMRDHYKASGNGYAAAIANRDSIIQSVNEIESRNDKISITVQHGPNRVDIAAPTTTECLRRFRET